MVAAITLSPIFFSTGILSPVIADWSIEELPSIITPSTGILSPGFTITISPLITSSIETVISLLSFNILAVLGAKFISFVIASEVFPLDFFSKYFPKFIRASIIAADSKYKSI